MSDILTPKQRSALMARIRSAGNASTELRLGALLRAAGLRGWRRGVRLKCQATGDKGQGAERRGRRTEGDRGMRSADCGSGKSERAARGRPLTVKPDFVFVKERLVIFVDGCFWHGCPAHYTRPKARRAFWDAKIADNRARDRRIDRALRAAGWRVLHVWEHALAPRQLGRTLARVRRAIGGNRGRRPEGGKRKGEGGKGKAEGGKRNSGG